MLTLSTASVATATALPIDQNEGLSLFQMGNISMEPTIKENEIMLVLVTPKPEIKRNDIVVFKNPSTKDRVPLVKRIIGLPHERIELKNGEVIVFNQEHPEGLTLQEPYLSQQSQHHTASYGFTTFEIPDNAYFALGDDRLRSSDSRTCFATSINDAELCKEGKLPFILPAQNIVGKVIGKVQILL